ITPRRPRPRQCGAPHPRSRPDGNPRHPQDPAGRARRTPDPVRGDGADHRPGAEEALGPADEDQGRAPAARQVGGAGVLSRVRRARAPRRPQDHAEAVQEHRAVEKTVMPDVHAADFGTPQFAGRVKVFGEMIDHHATEEETTMFKMARKLFSPEERAELDVAYEEW